MRKLMLLVGLLLPLACFASPFLYHINDGQHLMLKKDMFQAVESSQNINDKELLKSVVCYATDASGKDVQLTWDVRKNDYQWTYHVLGDSVHTSYLFTPDVNTSNIQIRAKLEDFIPADGAYIECKTVD